MASIKPLGDRVVVEPIEDTYEGPLELPESAKEKPQKGTVVSVGPGRVENGTKVEMNVSEGDEVIYGKYAGTDFTLDGDDVLIMRESDIFGIVN